MQKVLEQVDKLDESGIISERKLYSRGNTHIIKVICPIRKWDVDILHNALNLIASGPFRQTRMTIDSSDVLSDFNLDIFQQKIVDWIEGIGENELGPGEDT